MRRSTSRTDPEWVVPVGEEAVADREARVVVADLVALEVDLVAPVGLGLVVFLLRRNRATSCRFSCGTCWS
jgi:hypothetical protein